ncbi:hypothetical protein [Chryseobacterium daeguense]|uniref:hypothetical protein n=1 Tax=Chryseobacterium daeguense TaxID=412438 RepID=UPI00040853ED|nr:hypothetical protein [Chryseobacterium daeguense]
MLKTYSIVIHPQDSIIELFKTFKSKLYDTIGTYGSCNSIAHITILEFEATDEELKYIIEKLIMITQKQVSFNTIFDKVICSDSSKSIIVLPCKSGNEIFKKLLRNVRQKINGYNNKSNAHLTIGRKLKPEQLIKSKDLFRDVKFDFHCNQIAVRRFSPSIGQFEIIQKFPFYGKPDNIQQLSFGF